MFSALGVPPSLSLLLPLLVLACAPVEESPPPAAVRPLSAAVATTPPAVEWIWADGPVAWGEWSDANLARAQREDRPLLVYFAAPGCEGLFPDPTPALRQLVEEVFIGVRVDPFARPDIARQYDAGGWPALVAALVAAPRLRRTWELLLAGCPRAFGLGRDLIAVRLAMSVPMERRAAAVQPWPSTIE